MRPIKDFRYNHFPIKILLYNFLPINILLYNFRPINILTAKPQSKQIMTMFHHSENIKEKKAVSALKTGQQVSQPVSQSVQPI